MAAHDSGKGPGFRMDLAAHTGRIRATYWLLNILAVLVLCQQNLDAPNLRHIGADLGLDPSAAGARIGGAAFMWQMLVSSAALAVFGYLSDLTNRKALLLLCAGLGALSCGLAPLARTAGEYTAARALAGVGIGGMVPVMFSVIGDLFPPRSRAAAAGIFMAVANVGLGSGFVLGSLATPRGAFGWRASFAAVAAALVAVLVLIVGPGRLPERGQAEGAAGAVRTEPGRFPSIRPSDVVRILSNRTNLVFILSCLLSTMPMGYIQRFLVDFLVSWRGMAAGAASLVLLLVLGGSLPGDLVGGLIGDSLRRKSRSAPALFCALASLGGGILFYAFLAWPTALNPGPADLAVPMIVGFMGALWLEAPVPVSKAIMLNVNVPENRGTASAVIQITAQVGYGLGALIGVFGTRAAMALGTPHTPLFDFRVAALLWVPAALSWLLVMRTAPRDEDRTEGILKARRDRL